MSNPHLPPEILDHVVDNLHDEPEALQNCCLVAKSWIPRTRKHLFANITFSLPKDIESWKETFPDPSNSPAYHTHALSVKCPQVFMAADAEEGGWIHTFSRVVNLEVDSSKLYPNDSEVSLAPFQGLSSTLKHLSVIFTRLPYRQIFGLIRFLPLLEDLVLTVYGIANNDDLYVPRTPTAIPSPSSPAFTGTLALIMLGGMEPAARGLLDLQNGLHFRNITLTCFREDDIRWINALTVECSDTLESLGVNGILFGGSTRSSVNLSKATRLKDVKFWCGQASVQWVALSLQTVTSEHSDLQQISVHLSYEYTFNNIGAKIRQTIGETRYGEWLDLDSLFVQLWESRSIRPKIMYICRAQDRKKEAIDSVSCLLPEITKRGIIDFADYNM